MGNTQVRRVATVPRASRTADIAQCIAQQMRTVWARTVQPVLCRPPAVFGSMLVLVAVFLLTHRYGGIEADGIVYTIQALYKIDPRPFRHDLFFEFGSQTDLSLYATLFAKVVSAFGIVPSYRFGVILSQLLWWSGAYRLVKRLVPAPWHWSCLVLIAGIRGDYFIGQFSYDEMYLSARLPAEAFALWAIGLALERRALAAIVAAGVACAIHPLIGAVGLAVVIFNAAPRLPWWRIFTVGFGLFALAQFVPIRSLIFQPYDSEWLMLTRYNLSGLFLSRWPMLQWSRTCWVLALPLMLSVVEPGRARRFWDLVALVGVSGIGVSVVADYAGRDAVWIQLQTWRVLWLLTFLQWPALCILVWRLVRNAPVLPWLLGIGWLALSAGGGIAVLVLAAGLKASAVVRPERTSAVQWATLTPLRRNGLLVTTLLAMYIWLKFAVLWRAGIVEYAQWFPAGDPPWIGLFLQTSLIVVVLAILLVANQARAWGGRLVFGALLVLVLGYAVSKIDQRTPYERIVEARCDDARLAPFRGHIQPGQSVYWDGPGYRLMYTWFLLRTSSYFSPWQAVGTVFNRGTLFEAIRRSALVTGRPTASRPEGDKVPFNKILATPINPELLSAAGIVRVCGDRRLDFVVSPKAPPGIPVADVWAPSASEKYWLIACVSIRGGQPRG